MKPLLLLAIFGTAIWVGSAEAQQPPQTYNMIGVGAVSCGTWMAARRDRMAVVFEQWILGFLSGAGAVGADRGIDPANRMDGDAVRAWVDDYCHAHPLDNLAAAGGAFLRAHPH